MDDELVAFVEQKAKDWDMSLNKTIKKMLGFLYSGKYSHNKKNPDEEIISKLAGSWTSDDFKEFERNTKGFGEIDKNLWK